MIERELYEIEVELELKQFRAVRERSLHELREHGLQVWLAAMSGALHAQRIRQGDDVCCTDMDVDIIEELIEDL